MRPRAKGEREGQRLGGEGREGRRRLCREGSEPKDQEKLLANTDQCEVLSPENRHIPLSVSTASGRKTKR